MADWIAESYMGRKGLARGKGWKLPSKPTSSTPKPDGSASATWSTPSTLGASILKSYLRQ